MHRGAKIIICILAILLAVSLSVNCGLYREIHFNKWSINELRWNEPCKDRIKALEEKLHESFCKSGKAQKKDIFATIAGKKEKIGELGINNCWLFLRASKKNIAIKFTVAGDTRAINKRGVSYTTWLDITLFDHDAIKLYRESVCDLGCEVVELRYMTEAERKWTNLERISALDVLYNRK